MDELDYNRHFEREIIHVCVRWFNREQISTEVIFNRLQARGLNVTPHTITHWVSQYGNEVQRIDLALTPDECFRCARMHVLFVKICNRWLNLHRATNQHGLCVDFYCATHPEVTEAGKLFGLNRRDAH